MRDHKEYMSSESNQKKVEDSDLDLSIAERRKRRELGDINKFHKYIATEES